MGKGGKGEKILGTGVGKRHRETGRNGRICVVCFGLVLVFKTGFSL